ncbi:MAG: carbohydrate ABC transporter permease [Thermomicrobiales bacterium]
MNLRSSQRIYLLAIVPAWVLVTLFTIVPAVWAMSISFTPMSLVGPTAGSTEFVGLDNYRTMLSHPDFFKFVRNSVVFIVGVAVLGTTGVGLVVALVINRGRRYGHRLAAIAFGAVVLAGVCPIPLAASIWGVLFDYRDGVLNAIITSLGLGRVDWLGEYPMLSVIVAESWRMVALAMIVFFGALQTLPVSMYEAARLDGASSWTQLWTITLPVIRPLASLVLLMTSIMASGSFLLNEVLTGGGTSLQTETIALYSYHAALINFRIAYGAALSVIILVIASLFAVVYVRLAKERI